MQFEDQWMIGHVICDFKLNVYIKYHDMLYMNEIGVAQTRL